MAAAPFPAGEPLAYAGTALVTAAFYTLTAHIAARYVIGGAPVARAGIVGIGLAIVSLGLGAFGADVVIAASLAADLGLMRLAYREPWRRTGILTVVHYAVSVILGIALLNLVGLVVAGGA